MISNHPHEVNVRAWVAALRSPRFRQCRGSLRHTSDEEGLRFCAQGVACELAIDDGVPLVRQPMAFADADGNHFQGAIPSAVQAWLGLTGIDGVLYVTADPYADQEGGSEPFPVEVDYLNDCHAWTFAEIADAIESTYLPNDAAERAAKVTEMENAR